MKITRVDHIGIAVNSIDAALKFFSDTLGLKLEGSETVAEQHRDDLWQRDAFQVAKEGLAKSKAVVRLANELLTNV